MRAWTLALLAPLVAEAPASVDGSSLAGDLEGNGSRVPTLRAVFRAEHELLCHALASSVWRSTPAAAEALADHRLRRALVSAVLRTWRFSRSVHKQIAIESAAALE